MNKASALVKKMIILVLILAVPGFLYYLLTVKGKNRYRPLSVYGPKRLAKTFHSYHGQKIPDTVFHTVPGFNLTNQDGKLVSLSQYDNKILVVSFFYTGCPTLCKQANYNLAGLAKAYEKNDLVYFVSITVDPEKDTPAVLKTYAGQYGLKADKWAFLTGDTASVYQLSRTGFLVNALKVGDNDFIYSDKVILLDGLKRIRGYYSGTLDADVARLNDEIKVQITEELRKVKAPESY